MNARPEDLSHAMLIAVLVAHGGSLEIPAAAFEADVIGGRDGSFHAVSMEPLPGGTIRLSVQPRPDTEEAGITST
ncbi:pRL2-19 [Streptomyces soliscabiei]|uniref:pRL2-19 n=1 Tax=Streptomyces soliscabiei TaxID=588897 RepID=UPI0029A9DF29|nr:pRL2-19 [Streptomyces sp. NY05-11A]MDX2683695.1 pRL2-19 [Streptomyces sp. NY05-11A]